MKKKYFIGPLISVIALIILFVFKTNDTNPQIAQKPSKMKSIEKKQARADYYHDLLRDPATNLVPKEQRNLELDFAKKIDVQTSLSLKKSMTSGYLWTEVGPNDVGGRTRALAVDRTNSNTIISGGISGGIWKSTDNGVTWTMKSKKTDILSVTCIVQDPRAGKENIWYYGTGEWSGNSAGGTGSAFYGSGVWKSTDNGETWTQLTATKPSSQTVWASYFSYISNIKINPITGSLFVTAHGGYIFRSTDEGTTFYAVKGSANDHYFLDISISSDGKLLAYASEYGYNKYFGSGPGAEADPGIFESTDDGLTWTKLTITGYPVKSNRGLVAHAPSNPNIAYALIYTGQTVGGINEVKLFKLNLDKKTSVDRSANIPDFRTTGYDRTGYLNLQGGYNMVLAIGLTDTNHVLIGGTNLYRATDGFASKPTVDNIYKYWVGGYAVDNSYSSYLSQHADQHVVFIDPSNPIKVWVGHDGGISLYNNMWFNNTSQMPCIDKNRTYNVTQFYTVAIPEDKNDNRYLGGTQDNGSPWFNTNNQNYASIDISSGDGSFCYWGKQDVFVSSQNGTTLRLGLAQNGGNPPSIYTAGGYDWDFITPIFPSADAIFINPFTVDPKDESYVYFITKKQLFRNNNVRNIGAGTYNQQPTLEHWSILNNFTAPTNYRLSAVSASYEGNSHVVYVAQSPTNSSGLPKILRLNNSKTDTTIANTGTINAAGSFVNNIAINPQNSNEILVSISNYRVVSLWHSTDGGTTFTDVEGNLSGIEGPSVRAATIVNVEGEKYYMIATSIGVFATKTLSGSSTTWVQQGENLIGNVVCSWITSRPTDGKIVVATHGRGLFMGNSTATDIKEDNELPTKFELMQNYPNPFNPSTTISYKLDKKSKVTLEIFDMTGALVKRLVDEEKFAGDHKVIWNATNQRGSKVSSGVYVYRIKAGDNVSSKKMTLVK